MNQSNIMNVLVVGATGATGKLLTEQLLKQGHNVTAVVRSPQKLDHLTKYKDQLTIVQAAILDLSDEEMQKELKGIDAIASCLGHNLTFNGIYGKPRKLVRDAARILTAVVIAGNPQNPIKYILMNTTGNRNKDLNEKVSFAHRLVVGLIRFLLPPHSDNEQAGEVFRKEIGQQHPFVSWAIVRPDGLIDEAAVSPYDIHPSPTRDPIFNAGKTSRINVAHFMASLITDPALFDKWEGQMPVIYNQENS